MTPLESRLLWATLAVSVVSFLAYARDKSAAKRGAWRTPEATLHLLDLLGGWPGGFAAQRLLRHKNAKLSFQVVYWLTVVLHAGVVVFLVSRE